MIQKKKIYIITGISNVIGKEFMRYYSYNPNHYVFGISRIECKYGFSNSKEFQIDLLDTKAILSLFKKEFMEVDWSIVQECIIIHTAGKSKNELPGIEIIDKNKDGIDDEMYDAQITTFENLHSYIVSYLYHEGYFESIKMTVVGIGSLLDKHLSPIHYSMRTINNISRDILSHLIDIYDNYHTITLSVSTVATSTEISYRKYADQNYWLSGSEVVDKSIEYIDNRKHMYQDIEVFKKHPLFHGYFEQETIEQRIQRFKKETGLY